MRSSPKSQRSREAKIERRRDKRELKRNPSDYVAPDELFAAHTQKKEIAPLRALTEAQGRYITSIRENTITFSMGCAGTGKTYIAGAFASDQLKAGLVERIIITRPAVEAGESFGFLPGELEDKFRPYLEPFMDVLNERLGRGFVECAIKSGKIIASPLSFMRGRTFRDAIVILDEAQNVTPTQMAMFLTRIGENSKMIIDGDWAQKDIGGISGLQDAVRRLRSVPSIGIVEFGIDDIVRHGIIRDILIQYAK
jgi:phosphate starvation-inducible PhoH-like protein